MKTLSDRLRTPKYEVPPPGHAPDYFRHLRSIVRKAARDGILELLVVLYARISDPRPGRRETCTDQLRAIRTAIRRLEQEFDIRIKIIDKFAEAVSRWRFSKRERPGLVKARTLARDRDAILVAFDVSRFVRNQDCKYGALPTVDNFEQYMRFVGNVESATIASPKIHEAISRSTKRGQKAKDAKPGRPRTRTKEQRKRLARWLYGRGWDIRDVAEKRMVGASKSTVGRWLND